jgi:hypothetical protein
MIAGGQMQGYKGTQSITLEKSQPDILRIISEVGQENGYGVAVLDENERAVSMVSGTTFGAVIYSGTTGVEKRVTLTFVSNAQYNKLDLFYEIEGNFGVATKEKAVPFINEFIEILSKKVRIQQNQNESLLPVGENRMNESLPPISKTYVPINSPAAKSVPFIDKSREASLVQTTPKEVESQITLVVTSRTANVRSRPTDKSKIIFRLAKGDIVHRIERSGDWFNIRLSSGGVGWVHNSLVVELK